MTRSAADVVISAPSPVRMVSMLSTTVRMPSRPRASSAYGSPRRPPAAPSSAAKPKVRRPASLRRRSRSIPTKSPIASASARRASVGAYGRSPGSTVIRYSGCGGSPKLRALRSATSFPRDSPRRHAEPRHELGCRHDRMWGRVIIHEIRPLEEWLHRSFDGNRERDATTDRPCVRERARPRRPIRRQQNVAVRPTFFVVVGSPVDLAEMQE